MTMLSRRLFLQGAGAALFGATSLGSYAFAIEPGLRLGVTSYHVEPPHWPAGFSLKAAILSDIHACEPWMPAARISAIAELTNALRPDIIFLLGDFHAGHRIVSRPVVPEQWGEALSILDAPLGSFAILGNHDWWHGPLPGMRADGGESVRRALRYAGIKVLENDAVRLTHDGQTVWITGLADQMALTAWRQHHFKGVDDLDGTLAKVTDDSPIILLAHEPYVFRRVPKRVSLTLCGHTHGGQVNLPLISAAYAQSRYGTEHIYGHIVEADRHMVISAGLGTSMAPVRFMRPPEVVEVTIGRKAAFAPSA
jgi:predicted MPP superfamily phosphohydrolase